MERRVLIPSVLTNNCFVRDNGIFYAKMREIRMKSLKIIAVFKDKFGPDLFTKLKIGVEIFLCLQKRKCIKDQRQTLGDH
jgi:hypothetical protein